MKTTLFRLDCKGATWSRQFSVYLFSKKNALLFQKHCTDVSRFSIEEIRVPMKCDEVDEAYRNERTLSRILRKIGIW